MFINTNLDKQKMAIVSFLNPQSHPKTGLTKCSGKRPTQVPVLQPCSFIAVSVKPAAKERNFNLSVSLISGILLLTLTLMAINAAVSH